MSQAKTSREKLIAENDATERGSKALSQCKQLASRLSREEWAQFRRWVNETDAGRWDEEIKTDTESGKLDHLLTQADAEWEAGHVTKL